MKREIAVICIPGRACCREARSRSAAKSPLNRAPPSSPAQAGPAGTPQKICPVGPFATLQPFGAAFARVGSSTREKSLFIFRR